MIFLNIIFPVLLVIAIGFTIQKIYSWELRPLAELALYVLTPALIFKSMYFTSIEVQQIIKIAVHVAILTLILIVLIIILARIFKYPRGMERALILGGSFKNTGNYGLPIVQFAFGAEALAVATAFFVSEIFLMYTLGVFIAAGGTDQWKEALVRVLKMPPIYAIIAAWLLRYGNIEIPAYAWQGLDLLAAAAIPVMLLSLGAQLAAAKVTKITGVIMLGSGIRLLVSPIIAFGLAILMAFDNLTLAVLVLQAATPAGVVTTLFAIEYDTEPELVAMITVITTVMSFFTISILIGYLLNA
jgi:predicted permease